MWGPFKMMPLITHKNDECEKFFEQYVTDDKRVLFIGTLGFNDICVHFPSLLLKYPSVDFLFLIESRPSVSQVLKDTAERNRALLDAKLAGRSVEYIDVPIVADDLAVVAGRNAASVCNQWLRRGYSDVFVDASAMSRGVCFTVARQVFDTSKRGAFNAHIVVAEKKPSLNVTTMSNDIPEYMHGFQGDMDIDDTESAVKLWIPQLSEKNAESLNRIFLKLNPDEVCPIVPFPSANPLRGDRLLGEFTASSGIDDWGVNLMDIIYGHESDPNDVYETIKRIHSSRNSVFERLTRERARTVLSPAGTRIGSIGLLLAAIELDLPVMYAETMGYNCPDTEIPPFNAGPPSHAWHIWLRPSA